MQQDGKLRKRWSCLIISLFFIVRRRRRHFVQSEGANRKLIVMLLNNSARSAHKWTKGRKIFIVSMSFSLKSDERTSSSLILAKCSATHLAKVQRSPSRMPNSDRPAFEQVDIPERLKKESILRHCLGSNGRVTDGP